MTTLEIIELVRGRLNKKGRVRGGLFRKKLDGNLVISELEKLTEEVKVLQADRQSLKAAASNIYQDLQRVALEKAELVKELEAGRLKTRKLVGKIQRLGSQR